MWLFTPTAFVSIVAHRDQPEMLMIRARLKGDLHRMFPGCQVRTTPGADYRFRTVLPRARVMETVAEHLSAMTYDNVKDAIPHSAPVHDLRRRAMKRVWAVMNDAQRDHAEPKAGIDFDPDWDRA